MSKFSDTLVYLRKRAGFSQQELADKMEVSRSLVGMYESGQRMPSYEMLEALADIFNVNIDFLTGHEDSGEMSKEFREKLAHIIETRDKADLAAAEIELADLNGRESVLKKALAPLRTEFDYIIIDCPPSLGLITTNALNASDSVLIPVQCEYYALEGLSQLMSSVQAVKRRYNDRLELEGVLLTMYDGRLNLTQQVVTEIKKYFPRKVFATVIPRTVRLSEAPSYGQPILYYDKSNKGCIAYGALVDEILKKNR